MSDDANPAANRNYDLVTTVTPDGVKLHGLFPDFGVGKIRQHWMPPSCYTVWAAISTARR